MRKDFGAKTYSYPMSVFIVAAYDKNGVPNCMNAAIIKLGNTVGNAFSDGKKIK